MRTLLFSMALSIVFLSAGAFAGNHSMTVVHKHANPANVTIVHKNSAAPVLPPVLVSCEVNLCIDA